MGNVSSRPGDEGSTLYVRDQARFSIASLSIKTARNRTLINITPNTFPATRYNAKRDLGDDSVIEYVQDPETATSPAPPTFLLRLPNDDDLIFNFTFIVRQTQAPPPVQQSNSTTPVTPNGPLDTVINGLTFLFGSNARDLENLVTREFNADPNLHKNPNVELVGDFTTEGSASIQFPWSWRWKPPKVTEDRGGGWRTTCSFVEYNQRAHKLDTLATFSFWVQNTQRFLGSPKTTSPRLEVGLPPRLRVPSAQSIESRVSDSDGGDYRDYPMPQSPNIEAIPEYGLGLVPTTTNTTLSVSPKVDVSCQRPGDDISSAEDGPLFRATMKSMEQKTSTMRLRWKKVLRKAEAAQEAQVLCNNAIADLMDALREASSTNSNAVKPAIDHYFDKIAKEILAYERQNTANLQRLIIEPISKLYNVDIKQAEAKKKDFDEESSQFYAYVGRYLGVRQDSLKDKKRAETDSKYQNKRRNFELKRFDYSSFMQDLHGGRKDQEVLSSLTKYADAQTKGYLVTAKKIEAMIPQLEALLMKVKEVDKEFQLQRTEREEKRRALEKSAKYGEPESTPAPALQAGTPAQTNGPRPLSEADSVSRASSSIPIARSTTSGSSTVSPSSSGAMTIPVSGPALSTSPGNHSMVLVGSPNQNRFKGIRDLEEKDYTSPGGADVNAGQHRKEGLLWALSRPGSHVDPKGLNKQAWHKFWIVLDQGKLSEYTNWKERLELHMEPLDLRMASVREARNAERRFCFEVITPHFTRVYQATSEEDMKSWISSINNALQSAFEGKSIPEHVSTGSLSSSTRRDIASVLTGKSTSMSGHRSGHHHSHSRVVSRHATVGGEKPVHRMPEVTIDSRLLEQVRNADEGNKYCADCGSDSKVDWVSINLGIVLCIECSGIHRSLGTHISKVRSLTLDTTSFTIDIIEILLTIGNRVSNMIWEARLERSHKPSPQSTREQRLRFITSKYQDKAFVQPISSTLSHYSTPDETLLASIKKNDINNVLYALALGANRNATDRSRNTHAVFLALAAADPAAPASAVSPAGSPGHAPAASSSQAPATAGQRKAFPVAELLLQNGADLPTQPAPIPLSAQARQYLEEKAVQRAGKGAAALNGNATAGGSDDTGRSDRRGSMASSLAPPVSMNAGFVGGAGSRLSGGSSVRPVSDIGEARPGSQDDKLTALPSIVAGNGTSPGERMRERDVRLKRVSAGKLVKAPREGTPF